MATQPEEPQAERGRPTVYREEFVEQARKLCELGATDRDIADFFGVAEYTINRWKLRYPDFCASIKIGKEAADDRVEQSLYRKATGYSFDAEKIFNNSGEIVRAAYVEHVPPSDTAMIFWLKNRRGWRDKVDHEHSGTIGIADIIAQRRQRVAAMNDEPEVTTHG